MTSFKGVRPPSLLDPEKRGGMVAATPREPQGLRLPFSALMEVDLREHWFLGEVEIPSRLVLAPMAGVSVQAFRRPGRRYGAGPACSDMASLPGSQPGT